MGNSDEVDMAERSKTMARDIVILDEMDNKPADMMETSQEIDRPEEEFENANLVVVDLSPV